MKPRILVIGDDQALLHSRKLLLESSGAEVVTACGPIEARAVTSARGFHLALIDVTDMGIERGEVLCTLSKDNDPKLPVAFLVAPEMGVITPVNGDYILYRDGPKNMLLEIWMILEQTMSEPLHPFGVERVRVDCP